MAAGLLLWSYMKLAIVRHGETIENHEGIIQGQLPGRLSDAGKAQAEALGRDIAGSDFDVIYSSDLQRCVDTAGYIVPYHPGVPVHYSEKVREISFGKFQGEPSSSIHWDDLEGTILTRSVAGGESWLELTDRVVAFLNEIYEEHADESVLVVTHGGPMRVIRAALSGAALGDLVLERIPNCALWDFDMPGPITAGNIEEFTRLREV